MKKQQKIGKHFRKEIIMDVIREVFSFEQLMEILTNTFDF